MKKISLILIFVCSALIAYSQKGQNIKVVTDTVMNHRLEYTRHDTKFFILKEDGFVYLEDTKTGK